MRKKPWFAPMILATSLTTAATFGAGFGLVAFGYDFPSPERETISAAPAGLKAISDGIATIAEASRGALVFLSVQKTAGSQLQGRDLPRLPPFFGVPQEPRRAEGVGSGFFVDLDKGYIMTNNHVVEGADSIEIKIANGKTYDGTLLGRDPNTDIAIVQIKEKFDRKGLAALSFTDSSKARTGDFVIAMGAPFGLEGSLSFGVVSATTRGNLGITQLGDFIQTDAAINPGNSGGPLLNVEGKVLGVNTAIFSRSGADAGIGFAVPANLAQQVGKALIEDGKVQRGYIGAGLQMVTPELAEQLGLDSTKGALITEVKNGDPAAKAGLKPGDVITQLNGTTVENHNDVVNRIGLAGPNAKLNLTVVRDGDSREISLSTASWPGTPTVASAAPADADSLGITLSELTQDLKARFQIESDEGLVVTAVQPGSPADKQGLREGDLIVSVNKQKASVDGLQAAAKGKKPVLLRIERQGSFLFLGLRPAV